MSIARQQAIRCRGRWRLRRCCVVVVGGVGGGGGGDGGAVAVLVAAALAAVAAAAAEDAGLQRPRERSCAFIRQDGIPAVAASAMISPRQVVDFCLGI